MNRAMNREPNRRTQGALERSLSARTFSNPAFKRKDFLRQAFDVISEDQPVQRQVGMVRSKSNRSLRRVQSYLEKNSDSETNGNKGSFRSRLLKERQDSLSSFGSIHTTDSTTSLLRKTGLLDSINSCDFDNSFRADCSIRVERSSRADNSVRTVDSISLRHKQMKPEFSNVQNELTILWGSNPDLGSVANQTDDLSVFSANTLLTEMESLSDDNCPVEANEEDESFHCVRSTNS